jgi:hypothetical protein
MEQIRRLGMRIREKINGNKYERKRESGKIGYCLYCMLSINSNMKCTHVRIFTVWNIHEARISKKTTYFSCGGNIAKKAASSYLYSLSSLCVASRGFAIVTLQEGGAGGGGWRQY